MDLKEDGDAYRLTFEVPPEHMKFIASKGSVSIDGISLTVNEVKGNTFGVCIIPHTWKYTTLSTRKVGDELNFEIDMLARYVGRMMEQGKTA
ncbi:MAG: riboflavin synthase [Bdellovibrionales bacterium]